LTAQEVLARLAELADERHRSKLAHYGIADRRALGVSVPRIRALAKELGRNQKLAIALWKTRVHEARILAPLISDPALTTGELLDNWVGEIDSWDICDGFCSSLVDKTPFAVEKVYQWCAREEEFVRRAGFVVIAALAVHDKSAPDSKLEQFFPLFLEHAADGRNFVKKAVNWALREIGKRNSRLNKKAINLAGKIQKLPTPSARWIAADALRELQSNSVQERLARRSLKK
jgi:3-methyladenine DNA glycosylase AlkD